MSEKTINEVVGNADNSNIHVCRNCGKTFSESEDGAIMYRDRWYCPECHEEIFVVCSDCGKEVLKDECTDVGGDFETTYVCERCLEFEWWFCDRCGAWSRNATITVHVERGNTEEWCDDCVDRHAFCCDECGETFSTDVYDYVDRRDRTLCMGCAEESPSEYEIQDYHTGRDNDIYYPRRINGNRDEGLYLGVELEMDGGDTGEEPSLDTSEFSKWIDADQLIHFEHDSSLGDGGAEMISQPCTLEYHQNAMDWEALCKIAVSQGFRSHDSGNCGLHVHMSSEWFTETVLMKLDAVINRCAFFFERIARRNESHWGGMNPSKKAYEVKASVKAKRQRYQAVNLTNPDTVEIRIAKGSLNPETVLGTLELYHGLVHFLRDSEKASVARIFNNPAGVVNDLILYLHENRKTYPHAIPMIARLYKDETSRSLAESYKTTTNNSEENQ